MKRKITFALALLFVVGAALWSVNYRLNHPPLTQSDKEFRALVAGADTVRVSQFSCQTGTCLKNVLIPYGSLSKAQTRELIENIRFLSPTEETQNNIVPRSKKFPVTLELAFWQDNKSQHKKAKALARFQLIQTPASSSIRQYARNSKRIWIHRLSLRSHKRLNRTLDVYLPQRIRP